ncbi:MAG TPA: putative ABC exporter domain-containing protein [Gemmatimonadaceae bacterium]|nr:putative ABC exporter domain-containing protein [Gemmatimonadaceae bacterium]
MIAALWYLIWRTTVNRLTRQLQRVRSPRYAAAMLIGVVFLASMVWQPGSMPERGDDPFAPIRAAYGWGIASLLLLGAVHLWFSRDTLLALAFPPAEVQLLFPAPVSRRVLIAYRVARTQLLVVPNAIFWMFALRYWGSTQPAVVRFGAAWAFFSFLSLHRLGAALVLVPPARGVRRGVRLVMRAVLVAAVVGLVAGVVPSVFSGAHGDAASTWRALREALLLPPASIALAPFQLLLAPFFAEDFSAAQFAPLLLAIVAQLLWIHLASTVAFEETAAHASHDFAQRMAAFRRGSLVSTQNAPRTVARGRWIPLAPTGAPAVAIVWKNTMSMFRAGVLRGALITLVLIAALTAVLQALPVRGEDKEWIVLMPGGWMLMMSLFLGARVVRHDLRQDLLSLSLLKTYPLRGSQIIMAELAPPTIALTAFQAALIAIMLAFLPASDRPAFASIPLGAAAMIAILALGAINAMSAAIQNAVALMFPAWIQLGARNPGIESLGQSVLSSVGVVLVLGISFVVPVVAGALMWAFTQSLNGDVSMVAAVLAGIFVLAAEVAIAILPLGSLFERTEPSAVK